MTDRLNEKEAKNWIAAHAQAYEIQVSDISERRRLFSIELTLTVTGPGEAIDGFREAVGGNGFDGGSGGGPVDWLIDFVLGEINDAIRSARHRRRRRNNGLGL